MASLNPHTRELVFKLVFYGPGLGGKTTTLQYIYASARPEHRGKMVSLATPTDRTLYFDFLPLRVPKIRGLNVRLQLFTVPGQVYYAATRKLVLSGADGVVFVADSQAGRAEMNQESLDDLHSNLAEHNRSLDEIPHTFHWNKRDLGDLLPIDELERRFNKFDAPSLGTVATGGEGVFEGLERITRLAMRSYESDPSPATQKLIDDGVAEAMRTLADPSRADSSGMFAPPSSVKERIRAAPGPAALPPLPIDPAGWALSSPGGVSGERPAAVITGVSSPQASAAAALDPAPAHAMSFAELWPEVERESVRQAEAMLGARDAVPAILACDVVVTRALASAAAHVGTLDSPRDPGVVALLLGLDGARYLSFRNLVRAARHREPITMKDALETFGFALETRRARDAIRR